ncbi:MAG: molybdate ABC transporter permease subunit [Pyrinomonadaceae bacterium]|nr:molybdate ABC transporter permease subunit [Pyrinomonadaceae bacterium]
MDFTVLSALRLSVLVAGVSTVFVVIFGITIGFALARFRFRGKELLDAFVTLPLVLPPTVTGFYLLILLGRNGLIGKYLYDFFGLQITFTPFAAIIAAFVMSLPLMIKTSRASIESVNREFEFAAYTLGKNKFATFFAVTLPLAKRGIIAGTVLSFARALGEFGATLMLAGNIAEKTQTMPLAIYEAVNAGDEQQAQFLAIILTGVSVAAIYLTNKLTNRAANY